jgi:hypothetical protein
MPCQPWSAPPKADHPGVTEKLIWESCAAQKSAKVVLAPAASSLRQPLIAVLAKRFADQTSFVGLNQQYSDWRLWILAILPKTTKPPLDTRPTSSRRSRSAPRWRDECSPSRPPPTPPPCKPAAPGASCARHRRRFAASTSRSANAMRSSSESLRIVRAHQRQHLAQREPAVSGPLAQLSKKNATGEAALRGVELWLRESAQPVAPHAS